MSKPTAPASLSGANIVKERMLPTGVLEIGESNAPLVLMVFTNYSCNYCEHFHQEQFPKLLEEFITPGKLRMQIIPIILKKYPESTPTLTALSCAALEGKGVSMNEWLFQKKSHDQSSLLQATADLHLDTTLFQKCIESKETQLAIEQLKQIALSLSVELIPTFFLNGERFVGLQEYPDLRGRIVEALDSQR